VRFPQFFLLLLVLWFFRILHDIRSPNRSTWNSIIVQLCVMSFTLSLFFLFLLFVCVLYKWRWWDLVRNFGNYSAKISNDVLSKTDIGVKVKYLRRGKRYKGKEDILARRSLWNQLGSSLVFWEIFLQQSYLPFLNPVK
jgi:hypothetical protein